MKQVIIFVFLSFVFGGCTSTKSNLTAEPLIPPNECLPTGTVSTMVTAYKTYILTHPDETVLQINMDAPTLKLLLSSYKGFKLIMARDETVTPNKMTILLQFWTGDSFCYVDINSKFNSTMPGMRNQKPLCPPPSGCGLP